jgi:TATA-binding protein-associated factor Taf7
MRSDFAPLERKIEETVERLKAAKDPFLRREVLKELRRLLDEAERAIELSNKPKAD